MASDVEKRAAKALLSARSHIGSCRPDYDEDDAAWWDELTELAAALTQPAASGEVAQPDADTVRLDWLTGAMRRIDLYNLLYPHYEPISGDVRAAIDSAIKGEK